MSVQAQVVSCHKTELKKTSTDWWGKVDYEVRLYEFADSTVVNEIQKILSLKADVDSICNKSEMVTDILTMRFEKNNDGAIICHVRYSEKPFLHDDLIGCFIMANHYIQIRGAIPSFLNPTKTTANFSYFSHKINLANYNGRKFEIEEMGDDSAPQWTIEITDGNVELLRYYGIDD